MRILVLLLVMSGGHILQAQTLTNYSIPRITSAPDIDGVIGNDEWNNAARITLDIETNPGDNIPAGVSAEALLMEDGEVLYVAFIAKDSAPDQIRAFYRDRDSLGSDDRIGIVLDTFNDQRRAYQFFVNPLGVQQDSIFDDLNGRSDRSWNAIWDSAGQIVADGYIVELALPLKQLRFSPAENLQTWGIDLVREYPRDRSTRISNSPSDRNISCYLCQLRKAEGFDNLTPSMNLEIIPTVTATAVERRDPAVGKWEGDDFDPEGSLDLRWGITQDLYLNGTINPDFSQVEADSAQLDVNNTFSLFFPERRTFFLDGADYFDTQLNLVHTRNIADPEYGLKLTGKNNDHSYGLLTANDESTSFQIPGNLSSSVASLSDMKSDIAIARYRYDIFENSTIGALITDRRGDDYQNTVFSLDALLRPTAQDAISIQAMRSTSDYPMQIQTRYNQDDHLSDDHLYMEYRHNDRSWDWRVGYTDIGDDFRADMGFINRVGYKFFVTTVGRTWRSDGDSFFSRIRFAADYDRTEDQSGLKLEEETEFFINMNGPWQSAWNGLFGGSKTYWNGKYFDEQFNQVSVGFSPSTNLQLGMMVRIEDVVDFANTRLGKSKRYGPEFQYQWGKHLQLDLNYNLQEFDSDGEHLFTAKLIDMRTTYQFSARSFLRFTLQHTDTEREPLRYVRPVQRTNKELTTQLLYSYKVNAATRFFLGYSDAGFQNDSYDSIEPTNRTFFAKFSYAWLP